VKPLRVLSLGAGVQSSTLALMMAKGEIPPCDHAIFADTQAEPAEVYKWLDWLEQNVPFPVVRASFGDLTEEACRVRTSKAGRKYTSFGVPAFTAHEGAKGMQRRDCTQTFKIQVVRREIRKILGKKGTAIQYIGISLDEAHRMKPSRQRWITNEWPLIDLRMSRHDCLLWMERNEMPKPPRSACIFCPYKSDKEWIRLKADSPEEFQKAIDFELRYQEATISVGRPVPFLHSSRKPLSEVDLANGNAPDLFGNECEGMCGL
jgi:hypothetical protein